MSHAKFTRVGFLQFDVINGLPEMNLAAVRYLIEELRPPEGALLVLPELWATGFCYEEMDRAVFQLQMVEDELQQIAAQKGIYLAGTVPEKFADELYHNTLRVYGKKGVCGSVQKRHVFPGEERVFRGGKQSKIISTEHGKIAAFVCFDLRFPEVSRELVAAGADILICAAQWPKSRITHWLTLLKARAIENQIFVVACNASGASDGPELGGCSVIIAPDGRILEQADNSAAALMVAVQWQEMEDVRARFSTLLKKG